MSLPLYDECSYVKNRYSPNYDAAHRHSRCYHFLELEINDNELNICQRGMCQPGQNPIHLLKYHEVPDFLKGNPFVRDGYRSMLPFSMCMKSLLIWSNETLNIWTHLGGFFLFLLLSLQDNFITLPQLGSSLSDHFVLTIGLACYMFCMLCSTGFHIFCCHSERASHRWLAVDMTGVSIGIIGCYLPAVHYAFYCLSIWRDIHLLILFVLSTSTFVFQLHPKFFTRPWFNIRMSVYTGLTAYGILPAIHWIYLNGGISSPIVQLFLPKIFMVYFLGALAFTFYITKMPERLFPGRFDYIGSSHQWWHVMIVLAFTYWHQAGQEILQYRIEHQCPV